MAREPHSTGPLMGSMGRKKQSKYPICHEGGPTRRGKSKDPHVEPRCTPFIPSPDVRATRPSSVKAGPNSIKVGPRTLPKHLLRLQGSSRLARGLAQAN